MHGEPATFYFAAQRRRSRDYVVLGDLATEASVLDTEKTIISSWEH
jgi:hypothetical protein